MSRVAHQWQWRIFLPLCESGSMSLLIILYFEIVKGNHSDNTLKGSFTVSIFKSNEDQLMDQSMLLSSVEVSISKTKQKKNPVKIKSYIISVSLLYWFIEKLDDSVRVRWLMMIRQRTERGNWRNCEWTRGLANLFYLNLFIEMSTVFRHYTPQK